MRLVGTISRGIRLPVVTQGADLVNIVADAVIAASQSERDAFTIRDGDVVGVTESLLARAQGNYVTLDDIAEDVRRCVPEGDIALVFPILSRNRFYQLLRAVVRGVRGKVHIVLSYPSDEVGNRLIEPMNYYTKLESLSADGFDEETFYRVFGEYKHPFTGVDYVQLYKGIDPERIVIHFANNPLEALKFSKNVIVASVHARELHRSILEKAGAKVVTLNEICSAPVRDGAGYNEAFGLLGSNYTTDDSVKLFPRDSKAFAEEVQAELKKRTGKKTEVLVYGDGAFKDPVCGIWELADPVVSPGYTDGLEGMPKEIKLKYIADNAGDKDPAEAVREAIQSKGALDPFGHETLGTTPRCLTDLIGSLCDLTSGSGDKGTPVIYIQGYFDNYLDD
ncbi:coenzyme F420-0:L-glutamate ligase [Synergistaceae bacterium OttesenSCG-928-D05]|nr:coenzyme F420-0:L-glutamate ligase [Synergistaceae bacterium OttesenSCG-928-D05]